MDGLQNLTFEKTAVVVDGKNDIESKPDDWRHAAWIDYRALNGTIIDYDEEQGQETVKKLKLDELAIKLGVARQTLYDWEKSIPEFWDKVRARKMELSSQRRLSFMEDKFYIYAMTWKNPMLSIKWLEQNNPNWRDPRYKMEHEAGQSMVDLFAQLQAEKEPERKVIDAETLPHETNQTANNSPV